MNYFYSVLLWISPVTVDIGRAKKFDLGIFAFTLC